MLERDEVVRAVSAPAISGPRLALARLLWLAHIAVLLFLLVGWALPWPSAWWGYAIGAPIVYVGWLVFDDHCWLSILEARLRGEPITIERADAEGPERRSFVGETIHWATGWQPSHRTANRIAYGVLWTGFLLAAWRLVRA